MEFNPATGLPMMGGGLDAGGNSLGSDDNQKNSKNEFNFSSNDTIKEDNYVPTLFDILMVFCLGIGALWLIDSDFLTQIFK